MYRHDVPYPGMNSSATPQDHGPINPDDPAFAYDEFGYLGDNAREVDLELPLDVAFQRLRFSLGDDRRTLSALRWGSGPIEAVFIHGAAQNAHTWDTTAIALHNQGWTNLLCIDLPGHGRSDWRSDHHYDPMPMAEDLAEMIAALAPDAHAIIGMSLGGMTALALADAHPELVRKLVMVDVTPGVNALKAKAVTDFVRGPQSFESFGSLLARTMEHNPTRSESSLRRGILHNAHRNDDATWSWNYDRGLSEALPASESKSTGSNSSGSNSHGSNSVESNVTGSGTRSGAGDEGAHGQDGTLITRFHPLWDVYARLSMPLLLVRGSLSPIVDDDDVAEVLRRRPDASVIVVQQAGHSVQGDQPVTLAGHIAAFLAI
jgi:esterase